MNIQHISPNHPTDKGFQPGTLYLFDQNHLHDYKSRININICNITNTTERRKIKHDTQ